MKLFSRLFEHRFCAFCKSRRRVYTKKHIGLTNVLATALLSSVVSVALYGQMEPRALLFFCLVVGMQETFIFFRWRAAVICRMCGFDPVLYKRSPAQAAARVRQFFTEQVRNPRFQLSKSPLLDLQRRIKAAERKNLERQWAYERKRAELRSPVVARKAPVVSPKGP